MLVNFHLSVVRLALKNGRSEVDMEVDVAVIDVAIIVARCHKLTVPVQVELTLLSQHHRDLFVVLEANVAEFFHRVRRCVTAWVSLSW